VIETSVGVLAAAILLLIVLLWVIQKVWRTVWRAPGRLAGNRRARRREQGYRALTRGLVSVAAGDAKEAQRWARKADVLLAEPPLTLLLSAQAALLEGDDASAARHFEAMLARPETEFLGLRGLLNQALKAKDWVRALELARRARQLKPEAAWAQRASFELEVAQRRWDDAQASLGQAVKTKAFESVRGRRYRAFVHVERSRAIEAQGDLSEALEQARRATALEPDFVPAVVREAHVLHLLDRTPQAARLLERTWGHNAHHDIAEAYAALGPADEDPLERAKRVERLVRLRPDEPEGLITVAQAELGAKLWGSARTHLLRAEQASPSRRVYRLLAEIEQAERNDGIAARSWQAKAQIAPPEPRWCCEACGAEVQSWTALCPQCGTFDSIDWRLPGPARPPATLPAAEAAAILPPIAADDRDNP
jgi:HemY protein